MFNLAIPWWELVLRSSIIFIALVLVFRLFGKREVGQFTLFDLAFVLVVANAVQPAMTGPDSSLLGGLIIIAGLVVLNGTIGWLREHAPWLRRLIEPAPTVIARNGKWLEQAMRHEGLDPADCEMALREHGLDSVKDVRLAVLEADGNISVVPKDFGSVQHRPQRRRVRFVKRR